MLGIERVLLGIGSNFFNSVYQVRCALRALSEYFPFITLKVCSSYYESRPLGGIRQPNFLNLVVIINTNLSPFELLDYVQWIEIQQGRIRQSGDVRWGNRPIDIDILLFGNKIISTSKLTVPHYDMFNREFVLHPLFELIPDFCFSNGMNLSKYLEKFPKNGLKFWNKI